MALTWTKTADGYEATTPFGAYRITRTPGRRFALARDGNPTDHKPGKLDEAKEAAESIDAFLEAPNPPGWNTLDDVPAPPHEMCDLFPEPGPAEAAKLLDAVGHPGPGAVREVGRIHDCVEYDFIQEKDTTAPVMSPPPDPYDPGPPGGDIDSDGDTALEPTAPAPTPPPVAPGSPRTDDRDDVRAVFDRMDTYRNCGLVPFMARVVVSRYRGRHNSRPAVHARRGRLAG